MNSSEPAAIGSSAGKVKPFSSFRTAMVVPCCFANAPKVISWLTGTARAMSPDCCEREVLLAGSGVTAGLATTLGVDFGSGALVVTSGRASYAFVDCLTVAAAGVVDLVTAGAVALIAVACDEPPRRLMDWPILRAFGFTLGFAAVRVLRLMLCFFAML